MIKLGNSKFYKLKKRDKTQNSKCDKNQKNLNVTKLKRFNYDKTQKLKMWIRKNKIMLKLKNSNCDGFLVITTLHLDYRFDIFEAAFCNLAMFSCELTFVYYSSLEKYLHCTALNYSRSGK